MGMYESPIDIIYGNMQMKLEDTVFKAVQDVHVEVDRDELIKALQYDRGQYDKGFADGCAAPVARAKWSLDRDGLPICSNCGEIALQRVFVKMPHLIQDVRMVRSNFCPNCGAKMEREI